MAFPVNGIVDNFNRADALTLGSNWTAWSTFGSQSGDQGISSNQVNNTGVAGNNFSFMRWNPASFGPDAEGYITIATLNGFNSNDAPIVFVRGAGLNSTLSAYSISYKDSNAGVFLGRYDNNTLTQLGAVFTQNNASGDKMGISVAGSTLTAYYNSGSSWASLGTRTDSTYSAAGYIGFYIPDNSGTQNCRLDDFGGGTLPAPAGIPSRGYLKQQAIKFASIY